MACKLVCPQCLSVLKEKGDHGKQARGEYRIFVETTSRSKGDTHIKCGVCHYFGHVNKFGD